MSETSFERRRTNARQGSQHRCYALDGAEGHAMTDQTTARTGVVSSTELGVISREEWVRRYAARIMEKAAWAEDAATMAAEAGAEEYERDERAAGDAVVWWGGPNGAHNTPEDQADEEMSYWTDDGE